MLEVTKDSTGKRATGIVYVDANGDRWEQPADIVVVAAFTFENVRLMLLSGIGQPYDPLSNTGTTGRNYAYQTANSVQLFFDDKNFNPFHRWRRHHGMGIDDFNNDNFDHSGLGFVGGGSTRVTPIGAAPINSAGTAWHAKWGSGGRRRRCSTTPTACPSVAKRATTAPATTTCRWTRGYTDPHGRPLLRITFNFTDNDLRMAQYVKQDGRDRQGAEPESDVCQPAQRPLVQYVLSVLARGRWFRHGG